MTESEKQKRIAKLKRAIENCDERGKAIVARHTGGNMPWGLHTIGEVRAAWVAELATLEG